MRPRGCSSTERSIQTRGPSSGRVAGASAVLPCVQRINEPSESAIGHTA